MYIGYYIAIKYTQTRIKIYINLYFTYFNFNISSFFMLVGIT